MEINLTSFRDDPIFSDRQHQTFTDLFWLSNYLWQLILEIWKRLIPSPPKFTITTGTNSMNFFKSSLNLTLIGLLTCAGLATPVLATPDSDNSVRDAVFERNVDNGGSRKIEGDVTATIDSLAERLHQRLNL
jgi:hypothetical protein